MFGRRFDSVFGCTFPVRAGASCQLVLEGAGKNLSYLFMPPDSAKNWKKHLYI